MDNNTPKVFMIGIDGGTFDLIIPWVKEGSLPNIAKLIKEGVHGTLQSTVHPITPMAWSTIMTGKNPGKHGIFDFAELDKYNYKLYPTNGGFLKSKTIWKILSDRGKRVGIINIPFTYPPEKIEGFVISGYDARIINKKIAYPSKIFREIKKVVGEIPLWAIRRIKGKYKLEDIDAEVKSRTLISKYLLKKYPVDLFAIDYMSADQAQHLFWKNRSYHNGEKKIEDVILYAYQKIDEAIGEFIRIAGDDGIIMVISDHGGGEIKRFFSLNRLLCNIGILKYKGNKKDTKPYSILTKMIQKGGFFITEKTPYFVRNTIIKWLRPYLMFIRNNLAAQFLLFSDIDWANTKAFSWEPCGYGNIQINLKGRYPQGNVEPGAEYEDLCETIIEHIKGLKDPESGEYIVEEVYRREQLYKGEYSSLAPDLIVVPRDYAYCTFEFRGSENPEIFPENLPLKNMTVSGNSGTHRSNGIFIVHGKNIKKGFNIQGAKIEDIAPTVLYLLETDIPHDIEGKVLKEIFEFL
ncbi:MAG: alkaline phosphatase family protein [Candidatus Brocadiaceae bacterium]|nr:alkaline phosphatase family protein [Candidatus Brocadiaceae bacterium]